ncbi:MAG: ABC transporter permease subunit [Deltaproteobacteria bacterium]|nr:ABC transporter permease subunit [Deltaproteobacteria bacterium]
MTRAALAWQRFRGNRPAMFGLVLLVAVVAFAVFVPLAWPHAPNTSDFSLPSSDVGGPPPPSFAHPLGADPIFRDLVARLAAGAQLSLGLAAVATLLAVTLGTAVGLGAAVTAGTRLALIDRMVLRAIDVALAFPYLLLVTAVGVSLDRAGPLAIAVTLGATGWVGLARLVREKAVSLFDSEHVLAARALGVATRLVVWRHVLPGLRGLLLVTGSQSLGQMVLAEAVLGYLTVGVGPPRSSLGRMLQESEHYLGAQPMLVAAPALVIVLTVLGIARVSDGLGEVLEQRARSSPARLPVDALVLGGLLTAMLGLSEPERLEAPLATSPVTDDTLRLATAATPAALDPALAFDGATLAVDELVHARLVGRNALGELRPELAERFLVEAEGTRVRVVLRRDLRFHDGEPLVAADVKRSIERALHPSTPSPGASYFEALVGFEAYRSGRARELTGIEVVSELEVLFKLARRDASFPALLGLGFASPVCRSASAVAEPSSPATCGAGPYRLVEHDEERIVLERFDAFVGERRGRARRLEWLVGVPVRTQRYRFERGELDLLTEASGIDTQRFVADPRWSSQVTWLEQPVVDGIFLNTRVVPFDDPHVRRAVALAVDASVLPRLRPSLTAATRILPPGIARPTNGPERVTDLAAALEEMRIAGHPFDPESGVGGYPYTIDYITVPSSLDQAVAEVYQQQLARIGLRIHIRLLSFASYLAELSRPGACAMGWRAWQPDFPDPSAVIDPLLTSAALASEPTQNVSFYANPKVDALVAAAREETEPSRRLAHYADAERLLADDAPWVPVYANRSLVVRQRWIASAPAGSDGRLDLTAIGASKSAEARAP